MSGLLEGVEAYYHRGGCLMTTFTSSVDGDFYCDSHPIVAASAVLLLVEPWG